MFIAHLPAGYLLAAAHPTLTRLSLPIMIGAVAPDIDLLWFFLVDSGTHHHSLPTHRPLLWAMLLPLAVWRPWIGAIALGALLHLCLDSLTGQIGWAGPFSRAALTLVSVPGQYDWWVWSFLLHWTFLVELSICLAALIRWRSARPGPDP